MGSYAGFQKVKLTKPQRSTFDLSHTRRSTVALGDIMPILVQECVPSDSFNGSSEMLVRLAPLLAPIYDQIRIYVHYFFVPNRLLWEDWEEFITGGRLGVGIDPVTAPVPPYVDLADIMTASPGILLKNTLADHMGVPQLPVSPEVAGAYAGINLDVMPFAAFQRVILDYYNDRNFNADADMHVIPMPLPSGEQDAADFLDYMFSFERAYAHDYFTSALPFTQRGEDVLIPLDGSVTYLDTSRIVQSGDDSLQAASAYLGHFSGSAAGSLSVHASGTVPPGSAGFDARIENIDSISNVSTTINDFRSAYALQVWLERNAIGGSRYTESTQAHFGVRPQDSRLQRAEYIGGGVVPVKISEVVAPNFSADADEAVVPAGNMAGHGVTYGNTNRFKYFCAEHGFIIGVVSVMPQASYHQGMPRMFRRRSFLDYPWPTFAKLGEQQVDKAEVYANAVTLTEDADGVLPLFGYQSRYADWKYKCDSNHGDFHDTMLFWSLTRHFDDVPELGNGFISVNPNAADRIFAVPVETTPGGQFWLYIHNKVYVKRPLPYFGTPNTLGFV